MPSFFIQTVNDVNGILIVAILIFVVVRNTTQNCGCLVLVTDWPSSLMRNVRLKDAHRLASVPGLHAKVVLK